MEEEEFTTRIIHYFNTGILTLPEGTTLRSYLAEKLNCDPMRITKKYAGASCLGKRVYHLCDRAQATVADIEIAKAELVHLEHRFRLRVEHGQGGGPLPPRADFMSSNIFAQASGQAQPFLAQSFATLNASTGAFQVAQQRPVATPAGAPGAWPAASPQWLAPSTLLPTSATP